jgi:4-nitrophenyl phosphatase
MAKKITAALIDLDGTVYRGSEAVPGAARFLERLRAAAVPYLFVTNRANRTPEEICRRLRLLAIPCAPPEVLTSAQATAEWIGEGRVFMIGEEGMERALREKGLTITDRDPGYVVVSLDTSVDYAKLERASILVRGGARFVSTNPDLVVNTDQGLSPGNGAICQAIQAATGVEPFVVGKPEKVIMEIALRRLGLPKEGTVLIGDNLATDIAAGVAAGLQTALILTGVSTRQDAETSPIRPTWIVEGYDELESVFWPGRG